MKRITLAVVSVCFLISMSGCFRVGRMPATTASGPGYDDPKSAILVPQGSQTQILAVNNQSTEVDPLDKIANLLLNPFLMYLEQQVYLKQGRNEVLVRALEERTTDFGSYTRTTTTWRDFRISIDAKVGDRFVARADIHRGAEIVRAPEVKATQVALR